jgi:predicted Zn finger-like uncharacterized protein
VSDVPTIIRCPNCSRKLKVNDNLVGSNVRCPACQNTFVAAAEDAPPPSEGPDIETRSSSEDPGDLFGPDTGEERPAARSKSKAVARRDEDAEEEAPRRRKRTDDEEDDSERRSSGRKRRKREWTEPHRGTMILVLGLLGLLLGIPILCPIAWVLGNADLKSMEEGRMDPEGRGLTNAGRICGMIGTILMIIGIIFSCIAVVFIFGLFTVAANSR